MHKEYDRLISPVTGLSSDWNISHDGTFSWSDVLHESELPITVEIDSEYYPVDGDADDC